MAGELIPGLSMDKVWGTVDATTTAVIWIILLVVLVAVVIFVLWYLSYKWPVRVREIINGKTRIRADMAKRWVSKDGVSYWRLRKFNVKIPEPPSQAIDVTDKGQNSAEFYRMPDGSFIPITDDFDVEKFTREVEADIKAEASLEGGKAEVEKKNVVGKFRPFPTAQRALYVHEMREAEAYKKKGWGETLLALAPVLAIILVLVIFMIFFNDVVQPTVVLGERLVESQEKINVALERLDSLIGNSTEVRVEYSPKPPQ